MKQLRKVKIIYETALLSFAMQKMKNACGVNDTTCTKIVDFMVEYLCESKAEFKKIFSP
jgi:hypothetical protein